MFWMWGMCEIPSSLGSHLQITSGPFRLMIPIHWVWDEALIDSNITLLLFLNFVCVSIGHRPVF